MLADSVLADFISGLDLNISMLLYELVLTNLNKAIMKAKMIEMGAKEHLRGNSSKCKDDITRDRKSSSPTTISLKTSHQITVTNTASTTVTATISTE